MTHPRQDQPRIGQSKNCLLHQNRKASSPCSQTCRTPANREERGGEGTTTTTKQWRDKCQHIRHVQGRPKYCSHASGETKNRYKKHMQQYVLHMACGGIQSFQGLGVAPGLCGERL